MKHGQILGYSAGLSYSHKWHILLHITLNRLVDKVGYSFPMDTIWICLHYGVKGMLLYENLMIIGLSVYMSWIKAHLVCIVYMIWDSHFRGAQTEYNPL